MIVIKDVTVHMGHNTILDTVSCTLTQGSITLFIGKSGAGKTTLLKTIAGLIPHTTGSVYYNDINLDTLSSPQRAHIIGYVFQQFNLFPHMTVLENCIDPQLVQNSTEDSAFNTARAQLEALDMFEHAHKYPHELSGGQQQRVAIARALCSSAQVLLLDEPTASLDPVNSQALITVLQKMAHTGMTIGISTQDMDFAQKIAERVYYMENGSIIDFFENKDKNLDNKKIIKYFE